MNCATLTENVSKCELKTVERPFILPKSANRSLSKETAMRHHNNNIDDLFTRAILYLALSEWLNPSESEDSASLLFRLMLSLAGHVYLPVRISFYFNRHANP